MDSKNDQINILVKALLPSELFDYFEIVRIEMDETSIDVHLDELNQPPQEYSTEKLISKGFRQAIVIQDFPIRERAVYLHVRQRKWLVESSGKVVSKDWDLAAEGTRYTKGFATFLKELLG
jgi:transposase